MLRKLAFLGPSLVNARNPAGPLQAIIGVVMISIGAQLLRQAAAAPIEALAEDLTSIAEHGQGLANLIEPAPVDLEDQDDDAGDVLHLHQHAEVDEPA